MFAKNIFLFVIFYNAAAKEIPRHVQSFVDHELVPDILMATPTELLKVTFPSGAQALEGNILSISEVEGEPRLEWDADPDRLYTVIFCDADAPSRQNPEARSFLHWLTVNLPGNTTAGETVVPAISSNPEPATGPHRYVLLVYVQTEMLMVEEMGEYNDSFEGRYGFCPERFSKKFNLGTAIAGNFYQTENTEEI